jgi:hypothetical protein
VYRGGEKGAHVILGNTLVLHSSFAAVESGQIATVMAHWTVKVPCTNIKAVTLGGYVWTIFGSSTGVPPKVAYCGNTLCLAPYPFEAIFTPQDDSK